MANETGSDLSKLEYEFATNPNSDAFIPLAEAYLTMGRFVEAMVVCKKGIKAHPELPTGRLIMARIYADQAKHQKAVDELQNLLKLQPEFPPAYLMLGQIHLKLSKEEDGIKYLKRTLDFDPANQQAKDALLKIGIDYIPTSAQPEVTTPEPPTTDEVQEPPVAISERPTERSLPAAGNAVSAPRGEQAESNEAILLVQKPKPSAKTTSPKAQQKQPTAAEVHKRVAPTQRPSGPRPQKRIADIYHDMEFSKKTSRKSVKVTLYMGIFLAVALVVYIIYTWQAGLTIEFINTHLKEGQKFARKDTYLGYQQALAEFKLVVQRDKGNKDALSNAAFICGVLAGEYEKREYLNEGNQFLQLALSLKESSPMLSAAQGMMYLHEGGREDEAVKVMEEALKEAPEHAALNSTMGFAQMKTGNLSKAYEHLRKGESTEVRSRMGLGQLALRRSLFNEAARHFKNVLDLERGHLGSMLYRALTLLLWETSPALSLEAEKSYRQFKEEIAQVQNSNSKPEVQAKEGAKALPVKVLSDKEEAFARLIEVILKIRSSDNNKAAFAELDEVVKKYGNETMIQFVAAKELHRWGRVQRAEEVIKRASEKHRSDFRLEEASILFDLKKTDDARTLALKIKDFDPDSGLSLLIVGDVYLYEKKFDKAEEYYNKAKDTEDAGPLAYFKLGKLYLAKPTPDENEAQAQLESAKNALRGIGEGRKAAEAAVMLARIYAQKSEGNPRLREQFNEIISEAVQLDPYYAPPHCLMGRLIKTDSAEGKQQAKDECTKCVQLDSTGSYSADCREILKSLR